MITTSLVASLVDSSLQPSSCALRASSMVCSVVDLVLVERQDWDTLPIKGGSIPQMVHLRRALLVESPMLLPTPRREHRWRTQSRRSRTSQASNRHTIPIHARVQNTQHRRIAMVMNDDSVECEVKPQETMQRKMQINNELVHNE